MKMVDVNFVVLEAKKGRIKFCQTTEWIKFYCRSVERIKFC